MLKLLGKTLRRRHLKQRLQALVTERAQKEDDLAYHTATWEHHNEINERNTRDRLSAIEQEIASVLDELGVKGGGY